MILRPLLLAAALLALPASAPASPGACGASGWCVCARVSGRVPAGAAAFAAGTIVAARFLPDHRVEYTMRVERAWRRDPGPTVTFTDVDPFCAIGLRAGDRYLATLFVGETGTYVATDCGSMLQGDEPVLGPPLAEHPAAA